MLIQIFKILQLIHTTVRNITLFHAHTHTHKCLTQRLNAKGHAVVSKNQETVFLHQTKLQSLKSGSFGGISKHQAVCWLNHQMN